MDILDEIIWNNKFITVQNKVLYWREWHKKGIVKIKDLFNENLVAYSNTEMETKYHVK